MTYNLSGLPTVSLQPGATGAQVQQLQQWLVNNGFMSQSDMNTGPGIYGPKTTAAVAKLQTTLGVDNSSGVGYFGPRTLSALQTQAQPTQQTTQQPSFSSFAPVSTAVQTSTPAYIPPAPTPSPQPAAQTYNSQSSATALTPGQFGSPTGAGAPTGSAQFANAQPPTVDLTPGMSGANVTQLQQWLLGQGYAIPALQSGTAQFGYYGSQTQAALAQWQKDHGVQAGANFGYYGPLTMAKIGVQPTQTAGAGQGGAGNGANPSGAGASGGFVAGASAGGQNAPTGATGGQGGGTNDLNLTSTGNPTLDELQNALVGFVKNNLAVGNTVNPDLQITPDLVSKFLSEAHTQVDPYYQDIMNREIDSINASLKTLGTNFQNTQGQTVQDFQTALAGERNDAANNGVAFSGQRALNEGNMAATTNRTLASLGANYEQNIGDVLRSGAAATGRSTTGLTGGTGNFNIPGLNLSSVNLSGERGAATPSRTLDFSFNPGNYSIGSIGSDYNSALANSGNQFLSSYLTSAGNNSARRFQIVNGTPTLM